MLFHFIWSNKPAKIRKSVLKSTQEYGGTNMTDLEVKNISIKLGWIRRLLHDEGCWKDLVVKDLKDIDLEYFLHCNLLYKDYPAKISENSMWADVAKYWCKFNFKNAEYLMVNNQFLYCNIWHNSIMTVGKKTVFYKQWYKQGVKIIADLYDENTHDFYFYQNVVKKYDIKCNMLKYMGLLSAIPGLWKRVIRDPKVDICKEVYRESNLQTSS